MKIVTREQMVELDRRTIREFSIPEKELILRAGTRAADWIQSHFSKDQYEPIFLIGKGNNGEDGKVTAALLNRKGYSTTSFSSWKRGVERDVQKRMEKVKSGRRIVFVDAIFGTGLNRKIKDPYLSLIRWINLQNRKIIALDIPSGMDATTGKVLGECIKATHTLTFGLPKLALAMEETANIAGKIHLLDIGFPGELVEKIDTAYVAIDEGDFKPYMKPRKPSCYKNQFGHVCILGGSTGYVGAPVLAARSALRSGAGLVSMGVPESIYPIAVQMAGPEVMTFPCPDSGRGCFTKDSIKAFKSKMDGFQSLVIGPGMGRNAECFKWLKEILLSGSQSVVLDADGLNLISQDLSILKKVKRKIIFTPHVGEMSRLVRMSSQKVQENRWEVSSQFSKKWGVVLILKGARTLVAHPDFSKEAGHSKIRMSINLFHGNPGMAVGGSGDVLSGILGAWLARGIPPGEAARLGVWLHSRAGDLSVRDTGGDSILKLVDAIPDAWNEAVQKSLG